MFSFYVDLCNSGNYVPVRAEAGDELSNQHTAEQVKRLIQIALDNNASFRVEALSK
jgi:hypothetical protein